MKKITTYILSALAVVSLVSCNKWLDITPEDTTTEKQLFSDAGGYHSAINGLYQSLASSSLYGKNLTWGFASALSQDYDNASSSDGLEFSYVEKYEYGSDQVKAFGEQIWTSAYNVIANANNILQHLEKADSTLFPEAARGEIEMIEGEAIAVRALMHFDLLRLFAVSPVVDRNAKAIPYVTVYPEKFASRKTVQETLDAVEADLEKAAKLLMPSDSVGGYSSDFMSSVGNRFYASNSSRDFFFSARGVRLNYVAILSLLARIYLYEGDVENAYRCAKLVDDVFIKENRWYVYTTFSDSDTEIYRPHKMMDELLVCFYNETLSTTYENIFADHRGGSYKLKHLDGIFADNDDYRLRKLVFNIDASAKASLKYRERSGTSNSILVENRLLPVMRISEIHLIMAECLVRNGSVADAVKLLNNLRVSRGCMGNTLAETISQEEAMQAIATETRRESVAEGQYFFYCKRTNAATIDNGGVYVPMEGKYTMQIPDSEVSFLN